MKTKSSIKGSDKREFKIESKWKLKLKELIKEFRQKKLFYTTHSKFATYIDPDYLRVFETEVVAFSKKYIRQQTDNNMSAESERGKESHASTRGLHVQDAGEHAGDVAARILLNEDLARVGGKLHDLGHLAYAHDGQHMLTKYLKKHGIAELHHANLERYVVENEQLHEKTLERLEVEKGRPLTKRELKRFNSYKLIISDIAAAHNGEGLDTEIVCKLDKTDDEMEEEFINTFAIPGFDKKIVAKTPEAAVVRFIDPISYVAKDFRDGVIAGVVNVHDPDYEELFRKMGIPDNVLKTGTDKKDAIVRAVTYALRDDLEKNSRGLNGARMSKEMADLMYRLRDMNYKKSVKPRTRQLVGLLEERMPQLIDKYTEYVLQNKYYQDVTDKRYLKKFLKTIKRKEPPKLAELTRQIVKKGIEDSVRREVDAVWSGKEGEETIRRKRIQADFEVIQHEIEITDGAKEAYIQRILREIEMTPKQSKEHFLKYLKAFHPRKSENKIKELASKKPELRFETFDECLARFKATMYVGMSSNSYVLEMLEEEGLLSNEEKEMRYKRGGYNPALDDTMHKQEEARKEMRKQEQGIDRD